MSKELQLTEERDGELLSATFFKDAMGDLGISLLIDMRAVTLAFSDAEVSQIKDFLAYNFPAA
jgi:hypothetical protein